MEKAEIKVLKVEDVWILKERPVWVVNLKKNKISEYREEFNKLLGQYFYNLDTGEIGECIGIDAFAKSLGLPHKDVGLWMKINPVENEKL